MLAAASKFDLLYLYELYMILTESFVSGLHIQIQAAHHQGDKAAAYMEQRRQDQTSTTSTSSNIM